MAKCKRCGKGGLFKKLNADGYCKKCATEVELESLQAQLADHEKMVADAMETAKTEATLKLEKYVENLRVEERGLVTQVLDMKAQRDALAAENDELQKKHDSLEARSERLKPLARSIKSAYDNWIDTDRPEKIIEKLGKLSLEELLPDPELNCLTIKTLRARYNNLRKQVVKLCDDYQKRYTTKSNAAMYQLMVLALQSELENILHKLQYGKLDVGMSEVRKLTAKYYTIAADGNQNIVPTLKRFIGQIESLYLDIVETEYEYYVQRERAKEEQRAIREQMRQEAQERKRLELERKKVEAEEQKYRQEMERIQAELETAQGEDQEVLRQRLDELNQMIGEVEAKKDEITRLQNGKAGTVYVISNVGSFGEHIFKIGMTRRLEPQDRVDELGSASVPFPFDVHSFIFSEDAVALEAELHRRLNDRRVNKINLRKEFFNVTGEELQALVESIDPTAPFRLTALAEQYRQSLSVTGVPETVMTDLADDDDDDETE